MIHRIAALVLLALASACAQPAPAADEPRLQSLELTGTSWTLQLVNAERDARAPTIVFGEQNRASGFSGCNNWFAQVSRANNGLRFSSVGMTRRACAGEAMQIERAFAETLAQTRAAGRDGEALVLFDESASEIARLTPTN